MAIKSNFNSYLEMITDKDKYGSYAIHFNIDKRQYKLTDDERKNYLSGYRYHHKEHYYYKRFKTLASMKKDYNNLLNVFGELFDTNAKTEKVVDKAPTKKTESKKSNDKPSNDIAELLAKLNSRLDTMQEQIDMLAEMSKA